MSISDKNCIQICYGLTLIRVYFIDGEYYLNLVDLEKIHPAMFKKAYQARDYLINELQNKKNIDVRLFYRTDLDIKKKIQINDLNGYYSDGDNIDKLIHRLLLLLID
jgi:hypothetical protein